MLAKIDSEWCLKIWPLKQNFRFENFLRCELPATLRMWKITFHFGLYGGHKGQGVPNKTEEISMRPVFFPLGYVMYADFWIQWKKFKPVGYFSLLFCRNNYYLLLFSRNNHYSSLFGRKKNTTVCGNPRQYLPCVMKFTNWVMIRMKGIFVE